jgi:uncharacterized C2H2 Zn-finger protein
MRFFASCGKCGEFFYDTGIYATHVKNCDGTRKKEEPKKEKDGKSPKGDKGKTKSDTEVSDTLPEQPEKEESSGEQKQVNETPGKTPDKVFKPPIK